MAQRFYNSATVDLEAARENLRPRRYHLAVYHSTQAAEKAVKAAHWHLLAEEPKWTHKTDEIAASVGAEVGGIPEEVWRAIIDLVSAEQDTRYPSSNIELPIPADRVDLATAETAVNQATEVMTWVESLLQRPTGRPKRQKNS